jgi:replication factor A1
MSISDISTNNTYVDLICRVLSVNAKEFEKNGEKSTRYYGLLEDQSGSIPFSAWRDLGIARRDVVKITSAQVREWQGVLKLNINTTTKVQKVTDETIIEQFQRLKGTGTSRLLPIKSMEPGQNNISCTCKVVSIEPLEVKMNDDVKTVYKGILADPTGSIRFTAWQDFKLQAGMNVKIESASIKVWQGFLEMNLNNNTQIRQNTGDSSPPIDERSVIEKLPISALYDRDFLRTPEFVLEGTIIELKSGSGVIQRCTKCMRAVKEGECAMHGKIDVKNDLRLKAVLDDGTGTLTILMGKDLSEIFIGKTLSECIDIISQNENKASANEALLEHLLMRDIQVKGNLIRDDYGASLLVTSVEWVTTEPAAVQSEARTMLEAMELV